jgi:hypothetical protein
MNHIDIEKDIIVLTTKTVDILLLENPDALVLYIFYYKMAKKQKTNQVFATKEFCKKGLGFGTQRFYKAKETLEKFNLVEQIKTIDTQTKRVTGWYVKINYLWKTQSVKNSMVDSQSTQSQSTQNPQGGKQDTNALSKRTKMLKVKEVNTTLSFESFWEAYPKKVSKKKAQQLWIKNKLDSKLGDILTFIDGMKKTQHWKDGFIKHPTTFINDETWNDDITAYKKIQGLEKDTLVY